MYVIQPATKLNTLPYYEYNRCSLGDSMLVYKTRGRGSNYSPDILKKMKFEEIKDFIDDFLSAVLYLKNSESKITFA